jgi:ABC-type transport system involved in multi-copper enzyme maturation permease subunit
MNRGLLDKTFRELWPATLGFGLLVFAIEVVISFVLPQYQGDIFSAILQLGFVRTLIGSLLGTPLTADMGPGVLQAIPWVHPLVLLIFFAHEITISSRLPAGEIDRGTIDILLGLPVSRSLVYDVYCAVWIVSGMLILAAAHAGHCVGTALAGTSMPEASRQAITIANAYCLYLSIGCLGFLISSASNRRGRAIGLVLTIVVISFLINFLADFWKPAHHIRFLSLLSYYRPFFILQKGATPFSDMAMLLVSAAAFWTAGREVFRRRDICTL